MYSGNTRSSRHTKAPTTSSSTATEPTLFLNSRNLRQRRFETISRPPTSMAIGNTDHAPGPSCNPPNRCGSLNSPAAPSGLLGAAYLRQTRNQLTSRPAARVVGMPLNRFLSGALSVRTLKRARRKVAAAIQNPQAATTSA